MKRRELLTAAAPSAVAILLAGPSSADAEAPDILVDLVEQWYHAWKAYETAHDPWGRFDSPECLRWEAERQRLEGLIRDTPPQTPAGIAALCRFVWIDMCCEGQEWPVVPGWAIQVIREWAARVNLPEGGAA